MSDFLLIHGSCHGAWCWDLVIPELEALGHTARSIDLPGHGQDRTPASQVTLDHYARAILGAIDSPVTLVGHSMAGYPITAAAERDPTAIDRLIYLCAYVPMAGKGLADMRRMAPSQPLLDAIRVDAMRTTFSVQTDKGAEKFYHDVDPALAEWAISNLCPEPILPQETAMTPDRALHLPRRYIRCLNDRTIPPEFQVTMTADWDPAHVATLPTSHSPFLSDPKGLATLLGRLATN